MFKTQEIVGDIVFISFGSAERYKDIGLNAPAGHFKVLGYDNIGIWVSHPYLIVANKGDDKKKSKNKSDNVEIESIAQLTQQERKAIIYSQENFSFEKYLIFNY